MKISASLSDEDVAFLDQYAVAHRDSRSGALRQAISLLRHRDLGDQYEAAWTADRGDTWDATVGDGLDGQ